jgi:hypothetical protein
MDHLDLLRTKLATMYEMGLTDLDLNIKTIIESGRDFEDAIIKLIMRKSLPPIIKQ